MRRRRGVRSRRPLSILVHPDAMISSAPEPSTHSRRCARSPDISACSNEVESLSLLRSSRESGDPECSSVLGTNLAAVVPAKAGTHNHQGFDYRWPCHTALLRRMGPRLRGDDSGESLLHIFESGPVRQIEDLHKRPWVPASAGTNGERLKRTML